MGKVIAIANQKGGVGKTTTAINLGASLAVLEYKVLIIDFDPQGNATQGVGIDDKTISKGIYECIVGNIDPHTAILQTELENLHILPANIDLVGAEIEMLNQKDRELVLKRAIDPIRNEYDFILIDCSPSLGLLTVNALTAADSTIVTVQCEYFALEGLGKLLNTIKIIQTRLNPQLHIEGFLLTMYDIRLRLANQVVDELKTHFQSMVFETLIQRNVRLVEASSFGKPVILYDANSNGSINYLNFAKELLIKNNLPEIKEGVAV
ncbi:MAG TPA: AAA family ATPase [Bacteroidales bacterium]|nr:MAG: Sporulation initiation inhibitor protein Soj [Bacteroidetes bacterium ADurb.Bin217]HPH15971.1 AAA family ATPase [Bacteroidales bacterium]